MPQFVSCKTLVGTPNRFVEWERLICLAMANGKHQRVFGDVLEAAATGKLVPKRHGPIFQSS